MPATRRRARQNHRSGSNRSSPEYEALAEEVAGSGADLVFYGGIIQNGAGPLWRDIRTVAPAITMMGPDTLFQHAFVDDAGAYAEGTLITFGGVPPALLAGRGRVFFERYPRAVRTRARARRPASAYDARRRRGTASDRAPRRHRPRRDHPGRLRRRATSTVCSAAGASTPTATSTSAAPPGSPWGRALRAAERPPIS